MIKKDFLFTSESVTEGHPDKVCDFVADRILDELLKQDPNSRSACEVCVTTDYMLVLGEVTTSAQVDFAEIARSAIREIGYTDREIGFSADDAKIDVLVHKQSADIAMGVDNAGAGDQGMVFGYATNENDAFMPMPLYLSHKLTARLAEARKSGELPWLRPDGKAQVTVEYKNGRPYAVSAVVVSAQHSQDIETDALRAEILEKVIKKVLPQKMLTPETKYFINPTGRFAVGGPNGDSGVTGRKIIVDTYGGACVHGGGAFSGKDATKVDRSACYMARYVAKNIVAAGLCEKMRLDIAYSIGVAEPVAIEVHTFGTGKVDDQKIVEIIKKVFDLRPQAIIKQLKLKTPIFSKTTNYGHFGRDGFSWENIDKTAEIQQLAKQ